MPCAPTKGLREWAGAHQRGKVMLLGARMVRRRIPQEFLSPSALSADTRQLHAPGQAHASTTTADSRGSRRPPLPPRVPWLSTNRCPCLSGTVHGTIACTPLIEWMMDGTHRKERRQAFKPKTILKTVSHPHKLSRDTLTYKQPSNTTVDDCFS